MVETSLTELASLAMYVCCVVYALPSSGGAARSASTAASTRGGREGDGGGSDGGSDGSDGGGESSIFPFLCWLSAGAACVSLAMVILAVSMAHTGKRWEGQRRRQGKQGRQGRQGEPGESRAGGAKKNKTI